MAAGARTRKPRAKQATERVTFRLREVDRDWVEQVAERDAITPSAVMRRLVMRAREQSQQDGCAA